MGDAAREQHREREAVGIGDPHDRSCVGHGADTAEHDIDLGLLVEHRELARGLRRRPRRRRRRTRAMTGAAAAPNPVLRAPGSPDVRAFRMVRTGRWPVRALERRVRVALVEHDDRLDRAREILGLDARECPTEEVRAVVGADHGGQVGLQTRKSTSRQPGDEPRERARRRRNRRGRGRDCTPARSMMAPDPRSIGSPAAGVAGVRGGAAVADQRVPRPTDFASCVSSFALRVLRAAAVPEARCPRGAGCGVDVGASRARVCGGAPCSRPETRRSSGTCARCSTNRH